MTTFQKVIKGLAIAFALFLVVNIFFGILSALGIVFGISDVFNNTKLTDINKQFESSYIKKIDISSDISKIQILEGDTLRVEATNVSENIQLEEMNGRLVIKEKRKSNFFKSNKTSEIKLYIPKNLYIESFKLDSGVGDTDIEYLIADKVDLNLGVGNISISNIKSNDTKINAGVGNILVTSGEIGNSDIDLGVGNTSITAVLSGKSKIDCGVGDVNINLLRSVDGYKLDVEKGLGNVKVNNDKLKGDFKYGTGLNKIDIEAGMGNVDIIVNE